MVATLVQNQVTSPARRKPIRWTDSSCSVPGTLSAETLDATRVRSEQVKPVHRPPLQNGDRLTRAEFERRYAALPRCRPQCMSNTWKPILLLSLGLAFMSR